MLLSTPLSSPSAAATWQAASVGPATSDLKANSAQFVSTASVVVSLSPTAQLSLQQPDPPAADGNPLGGGDLSAQMGEVQDRLFGTADEVGEDGIFNVYEDPAAAEARDARADEGAPAERRELPGQLSADEARAVAELKARDQEVRTHELAHVAAAGGLAGAPVFAYQTGPDGRRYAIGGSVAIDTSGGGTPEETIAKAQRIRSAALAPADPSAADRAVAARASQMEAQARAALARETAEQAQEALDRARHSSAQAASPAAPAPLPEVDLDVDLDLPDNVIELKPPPRVEPPAAARPELQPPSPAGGMLGGGIVIMGSPQLGGFMGGSALDAQLQTPSEVQQAEIYARLAATPSNAWSALRW